MPVDCSQTRHLNPLSCVRESRAFRPPLSTILLANVQSLDNKLCELRARISYQRETRDCCVICLTETWMSDMVPDSRASLCTARMEQRSSQGKAEAGVFVSISTTRGVMKRNLHSIKSFCSPDLEFHMLLC